MLIGYARGSTTDQILTLQMDALVKAGCEKVFTDKASGAKIDRPELAEALRFARTGNCIVIPKIDRLGRSIQGLIALAAVLSECKIDFRSRMDEFDTPLRRAPAVPHRFGSGSRSMTSLEAIRAATSSAAEALGRTDDVGVIAGDPLPNARALEHPDAVIKGGKRISGGS